MAVVQGIKEKLHLPLYDSLSVEPEKQLRDVENTSHPEILRQRPGEDQTGDQPAVGLAAAALQYVRGAGDAGGHQRLAAGVIRRKGKGSGSRRKHASTLEGGC